MTIDDATIKRLRELVERHRPTNKTAADFVEAYEHVLRRGFDASCVTDWLADAAVALAKSDTAIAHLQSELDAKRAAIERLQNALRWCSGSADFSEGGRAYDGWRTVCAPLLEPQREDCEPDHRQNR